MASQERCPPARPPPPASASSHHSQASAPLPVHIKTYDDFNRVHDAAFKHINKGLAADERGEEDVAESNYKKGFELMDRCLRCNLNEGELLRSFGYQHLEQAREMQSKLNKTRQQIIYRLRDLEARHAQATANPSGGSMGELQSPQSPTGACALPSYEQAMSESGSAAQPPAYDEDELTALGESLMRAESGSTALPANATELLSIPDGVQLFFISPNGLVSAPSYPTALHVVTFDQHSEQATASSGHAGPPPAFLYVGDWVYPLIPGTSPSLHTSYGAYIFPDVTTSQAGAAVGLMLPDLTPEATRQFEDIIRNFTVAESERRISAVSEVGDQQEQVEPATRVKQVEEPEVVTGEEEDKDTASKISKGILVAADWITWGVGKGAEKAGELLKAGSEKLRRGSQPTEEPRKVDPRVQQGVKYARVATKGAVKVTGYIVNKLGEATVVLAKQMAPHVRRHGEKVIPNSLKKENSSGKSTLDGVVKVAASGLQGFGTVFMGLEHAAKALGKSLTQETVQVVTHKYGEQAGMLTENTMYTAGNVAVAAYNVDNMGMKAIAKRTAKETGRAVLHDLNTGAQGKGGGGSGAPGPGSGGHPGSHSHNSQRKL